MFVAAGARHVCVFAAGAGCAARFSLCCWRAARFFFAAGTRRVFLLRVRSAFFFVLQVRGVLFFAAGVWRGLFSTAGAGGGPCMVVGCGSRGVRFFIWARGGHDGPEEARACFCCGCAARLFVFLLRLRGGFVCGTAKADFHIHGRIEKNGMGWAWLGLAVKLSKTAAWLGWGRIGLAWPKRGWGTREIQPGGLGDKQAINRAAFNLAWLGLAWLDLVSAGVGGWGRWQATCPDEIRSAMLKTMVQG